MNYRLIIQPSALRDLEEAYRWVADRSPENAAWWFNKFLDALETLKTNPRRCPVAPESRSIGREIREFHYGGRRGAYRVLFLIQSREVRILHIRHAARQPLPPEELDIDESGQD